MAKKSQKDLKAKRQSKKTGMPPGTVLYVGKKRIDNVILELFDYNQTKLTEKKLKKVEEAFSFKNKNTVTWLDIKGLHEPDVIKKVGEKFNLHPLIQEDIANTNQRPTFEDLDTYLFSALKMLYYDNKGAICVEQVSIIVGKKFVISFQESEYDVFDALRERLRSKKGQIRKLGTDYLFHAIVDAVVDNYFSVLETINEKVEAIETELNRKASPETLKKIYKLKRELIFFRKSIWPLREVLSKIQKTESSLINEKTIPYFRDVYDHTIQASDSIESTRDVTSGMLDVYLSTVSNKMNEIMKVLTIFSAIFIPLSFLAGVYGMNFPLIPETNYKYGYFWMWGVFIAITAGMLLFFKKKGWLSK